MAQQNKQSQFQQPNPRTTILSVLLFTLVAFFVGQQFMNMSSSGATPTDNLITSDFVQAVEQDLSLIHIFRLRCRGRLILDEKGKPSLFAGFIANLGKKSKVDPLTGLFNKFEFEDVVRLGLEEAPGEPVGLMVVGIDDLRHINDRYDRCLLYTSRCV